VTNANTFAGGTVSATARCASPRECAVGRKPSRCRWALRLGEDATNGAVVVSGGQVANGT
jgi:hypothetical protein